MHFNYKSRENLQSIENELNLSRLFAQQPRCKSFPELASRKCELVPDPEDPCCKIMICPDPKSMDSLKPVGLPFDGCTYKNTTYKQVSC